MLSGSEAGASADVAAAHAAAADAADSMEAAAASVEKIVRTREALSSGGGGGGGRCHLDPLMCACARTLAAREERAVRAPRRRANRES